MPRPPNFPRLNFSTSATNSSNSICSQKNLKFETVFGVSASNWPMYDLEHGKKKIGYIPQDASYVPEEQWQE